MIGPLLSLCLFAHPRPTDQTRFTVEVNEGRSPFGPFSFSFPSPPSAVADRSVNPQKEEGQESASMGLGDGERPRKRTNAEVPRKALKIILTKNFFFTGKTKDYFLVNFFLLKQLLQAFA